MTDTDLNTMANELGTGMEESFKDRRPRPVDPSKPANSPPAKSILDVINEDSGRTTRVMLDRLNGIVAGLERDIADADAVRLTVLHRIADLNLALAATRSAIESIRVKGSLK